MNYKQQIGAGLGALTGLMTVYATWKQGVYYGKEFSFSHYQVVSI